MSSIFMQEAIAEGMLGIEHNHGGPFGAVIVKNGDVVGRGHNNVLIEKNPTLHGEIMAIKDACKNLNDYDLSGCDIYTTGEPCLMCLGACLWANIETIYYGYSVEDTDKVGFRDDVFDKYLTIDRTKLIQARKLIQLNRKECEKLFKKYMKMNGVIY